MANKLSKKRLRRIRISANKTIRWATRWSRAAGFLGEIELMREWAQKQPPRRLERWIELCKQERLRRG